MPNKSSCQKKNKQKIQNQPAGPHQVTLPSEETRNFIINSRMAFWLRCGKFFLSSPLINHKLNVQHCLPLSITFARKKTNQMREFRLNSLDYLK